MTKLYTCECGKIFDKPNKFNAHKSHCAIHFEAVGKDFKALAHKRSSNAANSRKINIKNKKEEKLLNWIAEKHTCEKCGKVMTEFYGSGRFCCKSCACASHKHTPSTKEHIRQSLKTKANIRLRHQIDLYNQNKNYCVICNKPLPFELRTRKTCDDKCLVALMHMCGIKSARKANKIKHKRSKNEIEFCSMCEEYFGKENVLHNEPMFNGWDADVILPKYKLAILWNGPWHYRKVTHTHSLLQAQNRDKIKLEEIKKLGYKPYIIKDLGKYNLNKVKSEFNLLLSFLQDS